MKMPRRTITAAALLNLCAFNLAQESISPQEVHFIEGVYKPRSLFVLRAETRLVEIDAVVRDRQGHPLPRLTQGGFQILDEGKSGEISVFSVLLGPALPGVAQPEPSSRFLTSTLTQASSRKLKPRLRSLEGFAPSHAAIFLSSGYQDLACTSDGALPAAEIDKLNARMRPVGNHLVSCADALPGVPHPL